MGLWRGVRVAEGAGLENRWALTGLVGSNPTLSVSRVERAQTRALGPPSYCPTPPPHHSEDLESWNQPASEPQAEKRQGRIQAVRKRPPEHVGKIPAEDGKEVVVLPSSE